MRIYLYPILTACYLFPVLAAVFTIPFMIQQYRRYGAVLLIRAGVIYTFIFYMMTSYFMTILPLPPIDSVSAADLSSHVQLVPFHAVRIWISGSGLVFSQPSTWLAALKDQDLWEILFNILLLLPFGVYLRYYFKRSWYQVLILSFLYSLFFELTQLSGLYHIYPYPYRYFDVDDLICNTLGGMLGYLITPALVHYLPSHEKMDQLSYRKGIHVSVFRRMAATLLDAVLLGPVLYGLHRLCGIWMQLPSSYEVLFYPVLLWILLTGVTWLTHGCTFGKWAVRLRLQGERGTRPSLLQLTCRYGILCLLILPAPVYVFSIYEYLLSQYPSLFQTAGFASLTASQICTAGGLLLLGLCFAVLFLYTIGNVFHCVIRRQPAFRYDRICHLKHISTVTEHTDA